MFRHVLTQGNVTTSQIIISALSILLVLVMGLFLYSDYRDPVSDTSPLAVPSSSSSSNSTIVDPVAMTRHEADNTSKPESTQVQPDKSLPLPAHQLKKLIDNQKHNDGLNQTTTQKITAANQAIATLDQQLANTQTNTAKSDANPNVENAPIADKNSQKLNERMQHIRDHLQQSQ